MWLLFILPRTKKIIVVESKRVTQRGLLEIEKHEHHLKWVLDRLITSHVRCGFHRRLEGWTHLQSGCLVRRLARE